MSGFSGFGNVHFNTSIGAHKRHPTVGAPRMTTVRAAISFPIKCTPLLNRCFQGDAVIGRRVQLLQSIPFEFQNRRVAFQDRWGMAGTDQRCGTVRQLLIQRILIADVHGIRRFVEEGKA